jgi:hypothetical protein
MDVEKKRKEIAVLDELEEGTNLCAVGGLFCFVLSFPGKVSVPGRKEGDCSSGRVRGGY